MGDLAGVSSVLDQYQNDTSSSFASSPVSAFYAHRENDDQQRPYVHPLAFFPTTCALIVAMHLVFVYQIIWKQPGQKVMATYRSIVYRKRFHRLWVALLSHPPIRETGGSISSGNNNNNNNTGSGAGSSPLSWRPGQEDEYRPLVSPSVAMGGPPTEQPESWLQGHGVAQQVIRYAIQWSRRQWELLMQGSLSGFPLLFYNSHILWSCRALEQVYNHTGCYRYARCCVALVVMAISIELLLSHAMVQATLRRQQQQRSSSNEEAFGEIQPAFDGGTLDSTSALEQIRHRVEKSAIGTISALTSAVLVLFHFQYNNIPLAVLPFVTDRFLSRYPGITYLSCLAILAALARSSHPMGVVMGSLVGLFWVGFSLDFLADSYHGNWLVFAAICLTLLSCKGRYPHLLPCIEYVVWYDHDSTTAAREESAMRPLSWCLQPVPLDNDDDDLSLSSEGENPEDLSSDQRAEEALLEFTRVRSESDGSEAPVDPDLLEQGRRPRRTRIQSQRL